MTLPPSPHDGAALPRRWRWSRPIPRPLLHALGLTLAVLLTWLVWRGYQQPGLLLDLANAMLLC